MKPRLSAVEKETRFRLRVRVGDVVAIGPGKIDLLEAIDAAGSLTAGAKAIGMSYRRAWLLLEQVNRSTREPAVQSAVGGHHGGGSALTETGHELVRLYRRIERTAERANARDLESLKRLLAD